MKTNLPLPNKDKEISIKVDNISVYRYPVRTTLVKKGDDIVTIISKEANKYLPNINKTNKAIVISEKAVAVSQGRGIPIKDIHPSRLAKFLSHYVTKTPYGIGLGMPETMELAIQEIGIPRTLLAFFVAAITKPIGIKGMFYVIAGDKARSIDGPTPHTIPPYNTYAVMGPKNPNKVAKQISAKCNNTPVVIIDANDMGQNILGSYNTKDLDLIKKSFKDNPLGQSSQQTPMAIVCW
jgi:F420-0:gamma-glutamyl ligase-like protein